MYEINHPGQDTYPTFTNTGTLYFNSDRTGGKGAIDIYRSEYVNGSFQKPEAQEKLNTLDSENDLVIDPDESFIIFNRYSLESKELDLYIAFRHNNTWGNPVPIESLNKKGQFELTPTINKYDGMFYYEVNGDIYSESLITLLDTVNR